MTVTTLPSNVKVAPEILNQTGLTPDELSRLLVPQLPPGVDPTQMQLAYGRRAVPKLVSEIASPNLLTRQKALVFLAELFHNPEYISQGLKQEIVSKLLPLLQDKDLTIRQKATECLSILATNETTQFEDDNDLVRRNVYLVFERVTAQVQGVDSLLMYNLLSSLVKRLPVERMDIQVSILHTLYSCIRLGHEPFIPKEAVNSDSLTVFTNLLKPECVTETKVAAAKCIMMLCFYPIGKTLACKGDTVTALIQLLHDKKTEVREAAAGALMSITIDCDAKRIMVRENAVAALMDLLDENNESLLLNVIKTITNVAEDYRGRFQLHGCLKKLHEYEKSSNQQLAAAAKRAAEVITWRP
ncbi:Radial spoke head 14 [Chytridiales sp. JEL 0842]|nr:Radial spoke head 14 [Chytridiales sp. JEL 0842]